MAVKGDFPAPEIPSPQIRSGRLIKDSKRVAPALATVEFINTGTTSMLSFLSSFSLWIFVGDTGLAILIDETKKLSNRITSPSDMSD